MSISTAVTYECDYCEATYPGPAEPFGWRAVQWSLGSEAKLVCPAHKLLVVAQDHQCPPRS